MGMIEFIKKTFQHNNLPDYLSVLHIFAVGFSLMIFWVVCISLVVILAAGFVAWTVPNINWPVAGRWFILSTSYPVLSYYWLRNKI